MRLSEGIGIYVQRKRADGFAFENGSKTLSRFRKQIGDLQLSEVTTQHVSNFLNRSQTANKTWRINHSLLRRFFEYFASRNAMPMVLMPETGRLFADVLCTRLYTRGTARTHQNDPTVSEAWFMRARQANSSELGASSVRNGGKS